MAFGEGANWDGQDPADPDGLTFDLTVSSTPATGVVRIEFDGSHSRASLAANLAAEWNARGPIEHVVAVPDGNLTAFFLVGPLGDGTHEITSMGATFDGKPRAEMAPTVDSQNNPGLSISRVAVQIGSSSQSQSISAKGVLRTASSGDDRRTATRKASA
jgi:hypothetical protein